MQFLSTIFAIIGLVAEVVVLWVIAQVFGRVGKPTGLAGPKGPEAFGIRPIGQHPSHKSIHDRADEGSDADCYLVAVLKGATSGGTIAGEGSGQAARRSNHIRHLTSSVSHSGRGAK